jgi:ribonucleoside-triphosphate reductase
MAAAAPSYEIPAAGDARTILISRLTCPNCRVAENLLAKKGVAFEKYIAEENLELCRKFGIKGAPTLVVEGPAGFQTYYSVNEIKKYLASH